MRQWLADLSRLLSRLLLWAFHLLTGRRSLIEQNAASPPPPVSSPPLEPPTPIPPTDGLPPECLLEHTSTSFCERASARLGSRGHGIARALYKAYFEQRTELCGVLDALPAELCATRALGGKLLGLCDLVPPLRFASRDCDENQQHFPSVQPPEPGTTEKYVLVCAGGEEIEMVAMPAPGGPDGAWSLCVSSQVGCRMGCAFCETGKMGLLRNLSTAEIVSQVALATSSLRLRVANVIFMGMGEPLDNVHAVIGAIRVLTDPLGLRIPLSHVTVSTSGEAQHVYTLLEALPAVRLAFSLHAANEQLRSKLMPINRRVGLAELAAAMSTYLSRTKRRVTIQYVLLEGVNDSCTHADELAAFLATVGPASRLHVNLIPYNEQSVPRFAAPSHEGCKQFKTRLQQGGLFVKIRVEKGAEKMAACGQLGNVKLRRELNKRRAAEEEQQQRAEQDQQAGAEPEGEHEEQEELEHELELQEALAATTASTMLRSTTTKAPSSCLCEREDLSW